MADRKNYNDLLRDFVRTRSESVFRQIVENYQGLVFGTARRQLNGDHHLAQDVVQRVFTDLARKASSLRSSENLGGWLHCHTCFLCSDLRRAEKSRKERELAVSDIPMSSEEDDVDWMEAEAELDDIINELREPDRLAIICRFFERQSMRAVGELLNTTEDAAQKRVSRAVERLREKLSLRGIAIPAIALTTGLTNSAQGAGGLSASHVTSASLSSSNAGIAIPLIWKLGGALTVVVLALAVVSEHVQPVARNLQSPGEAESKQRSGFFAAPKKRLRNGGSGVNSRKLPFRSKQTLELTVLAEATGLPIPEAKVALDWAASGSRGWETLFANKLGICRVPVPLNCGRFVLFTRIDGFADKRLEWDPDEDQPVPEEYTIRVASAKLIGGIVVDHEGNPVAGAEVRASEHVRRNESWSPERNGFGHIRVKTDIAGRWSINRIAPELLVNSGLQASHTNYPKPNGYGTRSERIQRELFSLSYKMVLPAGTHVAGKVLDEEGNPVAGARVWTEVMDLLRESRTDLEGRFAVGPVQIGKGWIAAEAEGFAATAVVMEAGDKVPDTVVVIGRGRQVRLHVQDTNGNPLSGAKVRYSHTLHRPPPSYFQPGRVVTPPGYFRVFTGADGMMVWTNAPETDIELEVLAEGFIREELKFESGEDSKVFVATPALTVRGTVTDASTGKGLMFRLVGGAPRENPSNGSRVPYWSFSSRHGRRFNDGRYQFTFDEHVLGNMERPRLLLRFEAEGYAPFVSREINYDEGNVVLDVELTAAESVTVQVFEPNGALAKNASVALLQKGAAAVQLDGIVVSGRDIQHDDQLLSTQTHGTFTLPPGDEIKYVIVSGDSGFAQVSAESLREDSVVQLRPWGHLRGVATAPDGHVPYRILDLLGISDGQVLWRQRGWIDHGDGNTFAFSPTPPGQFRLAFPEKGKYQPQAVEIRPAMTNQVEFKVKRSVVTD